MNTETWRTVPFTCACRDTTGGQKKVQKREYLASGEYPVVDQGQQLIAGYTNELGELYTGQLPAVLFGDHTRVFKYVDFPFALGADGVKALTANDGIDPKYLYYYLQTLAIPSRGYSRHFKLLKQASVRFPPPSEQRRIVEILDQADALRKKRAEADKIADRILPALFYKMFGDPATNPKGWDVTTLDDLGDIGTGSTPSRKQPEFFGGTIPWCKPADLDQILVSDTNEHLTDEGAHHARMLPAGATMMCCIGSIGKTGLAMKPMATNQQINSVAFGERITPEYGFQTLSLLAPRVEAMSGAVTVKIVKKSLFATLQMPVPPVELQETFSEHFTAVHENIARAIEASKVLHTLSGTLLHRAFSGDLTAKWRETHMKELLQEMEQQAKFLAGKQAAAEGMEV